MTDHEQYVELYRLLDRTWVNHCPRIGVAENCLATAAGKVVGVEEFPRFMRPIYELTGGEFGYIGQWNDTHTKEEVLAVVAECIAATAPEPPGVPYPVEFCETTKAVVA
jgi:hypothetical protein